jgi:hypothetical protein
MWAQPGCTESDRIPGDATVTIRFVWVVERGTFALFVLWADPPMRDIVGRYCTVTDRSGWLRAVRTSGDLRD